MHFLTNEAFFLSSRRLYFEQHKHHHAGDDPKRKSVTRYKNPHSLSRRRSSAEPFRDGIKLIFTAVRADLWAAEVVSLRSEISKEIGTTQQI